MLRRTLTNIIEYHIISKLIFLRLKIPKFKMIRQLFHVKNVHCYALYIISYCIRNHHSEFEIDKTILIYKLEDQMIIISINLKNNTILLYFKVKHYQINTLFFFWGGAEVNYDPFNLFLV